MPISCNLQKEQTKENRIVSWKILIANDKDFQDFLLNRPRNIVYILVAAVTTYRHKLVHMIAYYTAQNVA